MNPTPAVIAQGDNIKFDSQTLDQCLKYTSQYSGTLYQNICTGSHYFVPLGFWDYVLTYTLWAIGIGFAIILLGFALAVITDSF